MKVRVVLTWTHTVYVSLSFCIRMLFIKSEMISDVVGALWASCMYVVVTCWDTERTSLQCCWDLVNDQIDAKVTPTSD